MGAARGRRLRISGVGAGRSNGGNGGRSGAGYAGFRLGSDFISAKEPVLVFGVGGAHFGHRGVGLGIIVVGIPEQKADTTLLFRDLNLYLNILWRVRLGSPGEGLQPRTYNHGAVPGDQLETVHGLANKVLGGVAGVGDAVHTEEVGGVDHGREHVAVLGHSDDVLTGMGQVNRALPGHHAEYVEREQDAGWVNLRVGALQESGDHVGALNVFGTRNVFCFWIFRMTGWRSGGRDGASPVSTVVEWIGLVAFGMINLEGEACIFLVAF